MLTRHENLVLRRGRSATADTTGTTGTTLQEYIEHGVAAMAWIPQDQCQPLGLWY